MHHPGQRPDDPLLFHPTNGSAAIVDPNDVDARWKRVRINDELRAAGAFLQHLLPECIEERDEMYTGRYGQGEVIGAGVGIGTNTSCPFLLDR